MSPNASPAHSHAHTGANSHPTAAAIASLANNAPVSEKRAALQQPPPLPPPSPRAHAQAEAEALAAALSVAPGAQLVAVWKRVLSATRDLFERVNVLVLDALSALASPAARRDARHRPPAATAASECGDFLAALAAHERFRALIGGTLIEILKVNANDISILYFICQ